MDKKVFSILLIIVSFFVFCTKDKNPVDNRISIDMNKLEEAEESASQIGNIKSLIIQHDTTVLIERYFHGADENYKDDVMSVTKSFISALIGIAIDKGFIQNVDQTLSDYLSEIMELDEQRGAITIHQLLMMSCGLEWHGLTTSSEYLNWINSPDQLTYILDKPFDHTPEVDFNYSDGASHLLSVILTEATEMSAHNFAKQYLFEPLGFNETIWSVDNREYNIGSTRLRISPRDMLKFGTLYLNEGEYSGQQLISSEWVDISTTIQISTRSAIPFGPDYGYLWWITNINSHHVYFANGFGGQFIVIVPDLNVVVVATGDWRYSDQAAGQYWYSIIELIMNEILPAFS